MEALNAFLREVAAVIGALVRPTAKSLRENTGLAALSVVLAFGLWIFVSDAENPAQTRVLPVDLPVQAVNVPSDVVVKNNLPSVRARIRVEDNVFDSLTASDFEATVNLQGLTVGQYELDVVVRALTTRGGLRMEDALPEKITVELVELVSKQVPVVIDVSGSPASGFSAGNAETDKTSVIASGPGEKVQLVTQAVGSIDLAGRTDSVDQSERLEPRDDRGDLIENVTLVPPRANLSIEIKQTVFSRPVVVTADVTGTPAEGYDIVDVTVDPVSVTITGPQAAIQDMKTIATKPVSVDGETEDVVKNVSLSLPKGADISVIGSATVTVTVKIRPANGTLTFAVPVTANNLGQGLRIQGSLPSVVVTVSGPLPELLKLTSRDLGATVDLSGQDDGTHKVKVNVTLPDGLAGTSAKASPEEIQVTLEKI